MNRRTSSRGVVDQHRCSRLEHAADGLTAVEVLLDQALQRPDPFGFGMRERGAAQLAVLEDPDDRPPPDAVRRDLGDGRELRLGVVERGQTFRCRQQRAQPLAARLLRLEQQRALQRLRAGFHDRVDERAVIGPERAGVVEPERDDAGRPPGGDERAHEERTVHVVGGKWG